MCQPAACAEQSAVRPRAKCPRNAFRGRAFRGHAFRGRAFRATRSRGQPWAARQLLGRDFSCGVRKCSSSLLNSSGREDGAGRGTVRLAQDDAWGDLERAKHHADGTVDLGADQPQQNDDACPCMPTCLAWSRVDLSAVRGLTSHFLDERFVSTSHGREPSLFPLS